jgi:glycosyltransferase involved in cell wall biosynthesis
LPVKASRVVVVLHQLTLTGAPRLSLDFAEAMAAAGASIRVVSWEGGPLTARARALGPTAILRPEGSGGFLPRRFAGDGARQLVAGLGSRARAMSQAAALRRWRPDLVYVSSVEALPQVRMLRLGRVRVVLHVHELGTALEWFDRGHPGMLKAVPDRFAAGSGAVARDLVRLIGVPAERVSVVPPHVPEPVPAGLRAGAATGAAAGAAAGPRADGRPFVVGGAGKPSWTKGPDLWLLAARDLVDRLGPEAVRFVWVGHRDNRDGLEFRAMIAKLGLGESVELVPETDRPLEHFARFDVLAATSWEESASLVVLEAMSLGVPVVCFAQSGGPPELVGDAGIVVPSMSPAGLADSIVELRASMKMREQLAAAGMRRVGEAYGRDRSVAALVELLDDCVASRSGASG